MADRFRGLLRRPFAEQVAAFRLRLGRLVPTARWDDISGPQHDRAFMVAGAMKADLLADLAASVDRAISEGTGIEQFRRDFRAIVRKHGWHGWTGEGTEKGEAWRTRVIYRTNMNTTYMAGRRAQLMDPAFKFWIYRHSGALEPRLQHLSWDRLVLPRDHPFWEKHFPPNGWGCGCRVFGAFSLDHARRRGGDPEKALPDNWNGIDPRTGTPPGIQKGWDHAPGATTADTIRALTRSSIDWPDRIFRAFLDDLPTETKHQFARARRQLPEMAERTSDYARNVVEGRDAPDRLGLGPLTASEEAIVRAAVGNTDALQVSLTRDAVRHAWKKHGPEASRRPGERPISIEDFGALPRFLSSGRLRYSKVPSAPRPRFRLDVVTPDGPLRALFDYEARRRSLTLVTMFWVAGR